MKRTTDQLEQLAADTEAELADLDPAALRNADHLEDLRAIREIVDDIDAAEARLTEAIAIARRHGRSWGDIARVLGVTRQSAHAKYSTSTHVSRPASR